MSSQIQHKLFNYEVPPPQGVWNKIAESLDENISLTLSEKLYQYEEEPSTTVWQNISSQLDDSSKQEAKVVPFFVRYRKPLKYSAAVAIFAFAALLTSLFISKKSESELPAQNIAGSISTKKDTSKSPIESKVENSLAKLSEGNKTEHSVAQSKVSRNKQDNYENSSSSFESFLPQQAERNEVVSSSVLNDKYMMYSDDDGNVVRLPKKIFSAFACPADDIICKQKLQQLKQKFAASAMTADFNGLLQILKSLQENQ